jgi:hypothetical protein
MSPSTANNRRYSRGQARQLRLPSPIAAPHEAVANSGSSQLPIIARRPAASPGQM